MFKFAAAGLACLVGMAGMVVATPQSFARGECARCAPKATTSYKYKTVNRVKHVTRYKDTTRTHIVPRVHRTVTVTRIQPITRVTMVNRVHNRVLFRTVNRHVSQTRVLPTKTFTTAKTVQLGCRC